MFSGSTSSDSVLAVVEVVEAEVAVRRGREGAVSVCVCVCEFN